MPLATGMTCMSSGGMPGDHQTKKLNCSTHWSSNRARARADLLNAVLRIHCESDNFTLHIVTWYSAKFNTDM